MATRLAIREKQLETWTAIIQECIVNVNEKVYHSASEKVYHSANEKVYHLLLKKFTTLV